MNYIKILILLIFFSYFCLCKPLNEEEFFLIFENYYFPSQVYFDIDEEKQLALKTLEKLMEFSIELNNMEIIDKKKKFKIPNYSKFYLRVCYLKNLIVDNGVIIEWSEEENKYNIIPNNKWNYYKETSGLSYPYYLNCYFNIPNVSEEGKFKRRNLIKFKKDRNFCNKDFCYNVLFYFYLAIDKDLERGKEKIIFEILNVKENAPFSNKRIWEIYGEIKD